MMLTMERHWRDTLIVAMIPKPSADLPSLQALDRSDFWRRFDGAAPIHLRWGVRLASFVCVVVVPLILGHVRGLGSMEPGPKDAAVQRMTEMPLVGDLMELAKLVACLAYFDHASVQGVVRGQAS